MVMMMMMPRLPLPLLRLLSSVPLFPMSISFSIWTLVLMPPLASYFAFQKE